jgi:4-amino-4-deoxy-L-arabinose transferase-like glycosyltransferase
MRATSGAAGFLPDRRTAAGQALWIIAVFTLLRLLEGAFVGLGTDESYTVAVSRDLHLSYFDHPPLHYWIVHLLSPLLGYGRGGRLPFIALFAGSTWLMFRLTRRLFGEAAGVWAALVLNLTGFFAVAAGDWVLPDGPLIFFLLAAANALADGWFGEADARANPLGTWLWAGLWIGLAALSKYQAALFCAGLGLFLLTDRERRRDLLTPGPYVAAILTVLILSPVLIWNAQHHWASFAFQGGRGVPNKGVHIDGPVVALLGQFALLLPWVFVPLVLAGVSAARAGPADRRRWFCLVLAAPAIALFTLIPLVSPRTLPHWSMPGWLFIFPLLGLMLAAATEAGKAWPRRWAVASAAILVVVGGLAVAEAATGWLGAAFPKAFKKGDPTAESIDWTALRAQLDQEGLLKTPGVFVVSLKWNEAGKIDDAVGGEAPVLVFSSDPREFAYRVQSSSLIGHDAVIVAPPKTLNAHLAELKTYFQTLTPQPPVEVGRDGRGEAEVDVMVGHDLLKPYPQPGR